MLHSRHVAIERVVTNQSFITNYAGMAVESRMRKVGMPSSRPGSATAASAAAAAAAGGLPAASGEEANGSGSGGSEKTSHSLWLYTRKFVRLLLIKPVSPTRAQLFSFSRSCMLPHA